MQLLRAFCFLVGLLSVSVGIRAADGGEELLRAARDGNEQLALKLAGTGADVQQRGALGDTALHWAAFNGSYALANLLIERGADVDARVENGNTPLHQAAYKGHLQVVALLVASGATIDVINQRGFTSAEWARQNNHEGVFRYLLAHGAQNTPATSQVQPQTSVAPVATRLKFVPSSKQELRKPEARPARLPGLSTRLGDLPPLVLRMPDESASKAPALRIANSLGSGPVAERPAPTAVGRSAAFIQLGSFSTRLRAQAQWLEAIERNADLLKRREHSIVAARIGEDRTVHRLRVGPLPIAEARRLCTAFVARKAPCLVVSSAG